MLQFLITVLQVVQFLGLELIDGFGIGRLILLVFLILGIELYLYGIQLVAQLSGIRVTNSAMLMYPNF